MIAKVISKGSVYIHKGHCMLLCVNHCRICRPSPVTMVTSRLQSISNAEIVLNNLITVLFYVYQAPPNKSWRVPFNKTKCISDFLIRYLEQVRNSPCLSSLTTCNHVTSLPSTLRRCNSREPVTLFLFGSRLCNTLRHFWDNRRR